jgi:hypothetical protein
MGEESCERHLVERSEREKKNCDASVVKKSSEKKVLVGMSTRTRDETHEECHAESIQDKDEEEFEVKSGLRGESRHPIGTALRVSCLVRVVVVKDTYMVETIMAASNMKRESNQAVGLEVQRSVTSYHILVSMLTYKIHWIFHGGCTGSRLVIVPKNNRQLTRDWNPAIVVSVWKNNTPKNMDCENLASVWMG